LSEQCKKNSAKITAPHPEERRSSRRVSKDGGTAELAAILDALASR
jgi:hypothetical protein